MLHMCIVHDADANAAVPQTRRGVKIRAGRVVQAQRLRKELETKIITIIIFRCCDWSDTSSGHIFFTDSLSKNTVLENRCWETVFGKKAISQPL